MIANKATTPYYISLDIFFQEKVHQMAGNSILQNRAMNSRMKGVENIRVEYFEKVEIEKECNGTTTGYRMLLHMLPNNR